MSDTEFLLAAILEAQRALDIPPPSMTRQVAEVAAVFGWLSDDQDRFFRPAVSA